MRRIKQKVVHAIDTSSIIKITYKGFTYFMEPYMIHAGKRNKYYLHGWKRNGGVIKTPGEHYANFILNEITSVEVVGKFTYPLDGFRPHSKVFKKIIHKWSYRP